MIINEVMTHYKSSEMVGPIVVLFVVFLCSSIRLPSNPFFLFHSSV